MESWLSVALVIVNLGALVFIALQARELARQTKEAATQRVQDQLRRRRQSTMLYYTELRTARLGFAQSVEELFRRQTVTEKEVVDWIKEAESGDDAADTRLNAIRVHLSGLEWLAVGVNLNVFELRVVNRLGGGYLITEHRRFQAYIDEKRRRTGNQHLYQDLELLVTRLKDLRLREPLSATPLPDPSE